MQKPLCKFCGTRDHHASEMHLCKAMTSSSAAEQRPVKSRVVGSNPTSSAKEKKPDARDVKVEVPSGAIDAAEEIHDTCPVPGSVAPRRKTDHLAVAKEALTNAERCARYRVKHREKVLEADRLRKAKIRGSPSG